MSTQDSVHAPPAANSPADYSVCLKDGTRSRQGCWTCRLRKKKCDESHPSCSTCIGLKLTCYGYGLRPDWMDGGRLQQKQAIHVKHIIKQNSKKQWYRDLQRGSFLQVTTLQGNLTLPPGVATSVASSSPGGTHPVGLSDSSREYVSFEASDAAPTGCDPLMLDSLHNDCVAPQDPGLNNSNNTLQLLSQRHNVCLESSLWSIGRISELQHYKPNSVRVEMNQAIPRQSDRSTSSQVNISLVEGSTGDNQNNRVPSALKPVRRYLIPPIDRGNEGTLFMHYLDHVFYVQFPFYNSSLTSGGRGWLYNLLMQDKSVYHAALALSQYHRHTTLERNDSTDEIAPFQYTGEYYILALRELQDTIGASHTWTGTAGLIDSVRALTCSLLLLFFEVFRGATTSWQMHLHAAASLAPQIVKAWTLPPEDDFEISKTQHEWADMRVLSSEDRTTITVLISTFIWFDVLAGASTGSRHFLNVDHILLLEGSIIHLEALIGCENWVIVLIFRISELRNWKRELESNHRLSISELAKQGADIEACLQERLGKMSTQNTVQEGGFSGATRRYPKSARAVITRIFALSALTYLHVIVSGPISELPEITDSVTRTIAEFSDLSDARSLRYLVWPFCITGCLASKEQHGFFRDLISAGDISERTVGACMGAFKVMEECWKRKMRSQNCDWISVMESLGHLILLA